MEFQSFYESPFKLKFSFEKLIQKMEAEASQNPEYELYHRNILNEIKQYPELITGIKNLHFFEYKE